MLERLIGLENEYAFRFSDADGGPRPSHADLYDELILEIQALTRTLPGEKRGGKPRQFLENGGVFAYEAVPWALADGLIEGGTPECRGPGTVLLYQRAQEALLERACAQLTRVYREQRGRPGVTVGLLRNCRDAEGNIYGAQENYEVTIASGARLWLWRAGLLALMPLLLLGALASWALALVFLIVALVIVAAFIVAALLAGLIPALERMAWWRWFDDPEHMATFERKVGLFTRTLSHGLYGVPLRLFSALVARVGFVEVRRDLTAFLMSRPILSGAGTLLPSRDFALSEKGVAANALLRRGVSEEVHAVYDLGNLMKLLTGFETLNARKYLRLFAPRQRMQLGIADANRCQYAEYLKLGTTALILDMAEAGALQDAPQLADPLAALTTYVHDPTLEDAAPLTDGTTMSALDVQRWYAARAQAWLAAHPAPSIEALELVRLWHEALDALEHDPESLVGRVDWITKRYLMQTAGDTDELAVLKKIDLRYHELGDGYLRRMEQVGAAPSLLDDDEIQAAQTTPPQDTPAVARARLIRRFAGAEVPVSIDWTIARVGPRFRARIVRLDQPHTDDLDSL